MAERVANDDVGAAGVIQRRHDIRSDKTGAAGHQQHSIPCPDCAIQPERLPAKACPGRNPGRIPVRVKKTRRNKNQSLRSDSIGTEKALAHDPPKCKRFGGRARADFDAYRVTLRVGAATQGPASVDAKPTRYEYIFTT